MGCYRIRIVSPPPVKRRIHYDEALARREAFASLRDPLLDPVLHGLKRVAPVLIDRLQREAYVQHVRFWITEDPDGGFIQRDGDRVVFNAAAMIHFIRGCNRVFVQNALDLSGGTPLPPNASEVVFEAYALAAAEFRHAGIPERQANDALATAQAAMSVRLSGSELTEAGRLLKILLQKTAEWKMFFSHDPPMPFDILREPVLGHSGKVFEAGISPLLQEAGFDHDQAVHAATRLTRLQPGAVESLVAAGWLSRQAADRIHSLKLPEKEDVKHLVVSMLAEQAGLQESGVTLFVLKTVVFRQLIPRIFFDEQTKKRRDLTELRLLLEPREIRRWIPGRDVLPASFVSQPEADAGPWLEISTALASSIPS